GCKDSISQMVTINANRQPSMTYSNGTCDSIFTFTNSSTNAISSQWSFGDGGSSNVLNAQHTYERTGPTTVSLVTMTPSGCMDTIRQTILVVIRTPAR